MYMKNLYLYGSGKRCEVLLRYIQKNQYRVCGIIDSNSNRWGKNINGISVFPPEELSNKKDIYVCVTFYSTLVYEPVWDMLEKEYEIEKSHLISFYDILIEAYRNIIKINLYNNGDGYQKAYFDGTWGLGLGGVESWLKDITELFVKFEVTDCYLLTPLNENIPDEIKNKVHGFSIDKSGEYLPDEVQKAADFVTCNMPCTIVLSRIDEIMLASFLVKERYPDNVHIIMADHGSCDGMYRDILSFRSMIDNYVCVSSGIRDELIKRGVDSAKVYTMTAPMSYDDDLIRHYTIDALEPLKIGYAGRLEIFEKRMDILLLLIEELQHIGVKYIFSIAGSGSFQKNIQEYIDNNALNGKIKLLGNVERSKIADFWKKQDIAINVSDNEGRPISNMEAMLNGAVPVVTNTVGATEDVCDGRNGYVVSICDYKEMARKIQYIGCHREWLMTLGRQAYLDMKGKMNQEQYVTMWKNLIFQNR